MTPREPYKNIFFLISFWLYYYFTERYKQINKSWQRLLLSEGKLIA